MISPKNSRPQSALLPSLTKKSSNISIINVKNQIPDIDTVCQELLNGTNYEYDLYYTPDEIISHLNQMCDLLMNQNEDEDFDYDLLQRIDEVIRNVESKNEELNNDLLHKSEMDQLNNKLDMTQKEITQINDRYLFVKQQFEEKKEEDLKKLKIQQKKEIEEFKIKYSIDNIPPRYKKLSSDLISLRNQERKLRIMHKFNEAKIIRDEGDRKEKAEIENNYRKWQNEREVAKAALIKKHRQQISCLNEKWNRHMQVLEQGLVHEQDNKKLVIQKTQRKVNEARIRKDLQTPKSSRSSSISRISTSRSKSVKSSLT